MNHLKEFPIIHEQRVEWGDMDAHGHVNNVVYFRYIENARITYYETIKKYEYEKRNGVSFVVGSTSCNFRYPLTYPDVVLIGARVSMIKNSHIVMKYSIFSTFHKQVVADAEAVIVSYDYGKQTKITFPTELRGNIILLEKTDPTGRDFDDEKDGQRNKNNIGD